MFTQNTYQEDIKPFNKILTAEAETLLVAQDLTVIYIGRETCPFCRKFAKKLSGLAPKIDATIYYIDSSNPLDTGINDFREAYDIVTVPGFIVSKKGKITVRCDSSTPEEEILAILK